MHLCKHLLAIYEKKIKKLKVWVLHINLIYSQVARITLYCSFKLIY